MSLDRSSLNPPLGVPGFAYADLYDGERLNALASTFDSFFERRDPSLYARFSAYRSAVQSGLASGGLTTIEESKLLVDAGRHLSAFLAKLFDVEDELERMRLRARRDAEVSRFKKDFVVRRLAKMTAAASAAVGDETVEAILRSILGGASEHDPEHLLASAVNRLTDIEKDYPRSLPAGRAYAPTAESRASLHQIVEELRRRRIQLPPAALAQGAKLTDSTSPEGLAREAAAVHAVLDVIADWAFERRINPSSRWALPSWTSFRLPHALHFDRLVDTRESGDLAGSFYGPEETRRRRDGFTLTDARYSPREVSDEANYCIFCHERDKDSCSAGFVEKDGTWKRNPLSVPLHGCPLDEKIGESNLLRSEGDALGALALIVVDNPMCPGTGHRICNDCMKSCIFQKQEPVNIPQIETGSLTDVLDLPFGFEIYSLLTRWNPLNARRPVMGSYNGRNVLVVGLGPAGYTLAHYLANEGFGVVGIDALKLEPLPVEWVGGDGQIPVPIADVSSLRTRLDHRVLAGFGGVSEYGITVRWDKNFLTIIRLTLERRKNIRFYGGVRFGGTLTLDDAFDRFGFDHVAVAAGAGTPTLVRMKNNLIRGIRKASDFLMALQLTGAFKENSMANLQVRLPAVVIGGGLTAIDTATELFAYYPIQVEKILERFESLCEQFGEESVRASYDQEERTILDEFLEHGRAVREERRRASADGTEPDFVPLVRSWGGVTLAYRKSLLDSPAYRLNHEEVIKALEEGIGYAENLSPVEAVPDETGHVRAMLFERQTVEDGRWKDTGSIIEIPARTVMVAAGTSPNVIYEKEHPGTFRLDPNGYFFLSHRASQRDGALVLEPVEDSTGPAGFFTSYRHTTDPRKLVSFYGDNHPRYAGNVVKAMASAKHGYLDVLALFPDQGSGDWNALVATLDDQLLATVVRVERLTPTIVEVVVRAPLAAEKFEPGQFFRLQNFESNAREVSGTKLVMEGLALTGASTDPEKGHLSTIVLEMGGSSRLCAYLQPGEPVVLMGPTGAPTDIPKNETVLLLGGGLGNAVLFSIARALKDNGCRVLYFAGYKKREDLFKRDEIEAATDRVIWSVDLGEPIPARRESDASFVGNIIRAMLAYGRGELGVDPSSLPLSDATRIIAIGSDGMMRAVKDARHGVLAPMLNPEHVGVGSINSPMQCMMKQICAQCLQRHVDPKTGRESFVFSCFNQDQHLDEVDFGHLRARLRQNSVMEKLTNLWLTKVLSGAAGAQMQ